MLNTITLPGLRITKTNQQKLNLKVSFSLSKQENQTNLGDS